MSDEKRTTSFYAIRIGIVFIFTMFLYAILALSFSKKESHTAVTVYAFSDMLSSEVFEPFTEKTGIAVVVKHFEAAEEVITKLVFAGDDSIDVIAPTDSTVEVLRKEKLLQEVQRNRLKHFGDIDRRLMGKYFDPENRYSVPFSWSPVAIGYDPRVITTPREEIDWDIVFGIAKDGEILPPSVKYGKGLGRICMGEDPWEVVFIAALHEWGSIKNITPDKYDRIVERLRAQKEWLECYTNNLKYFLISGVSHAVVMPAAYMVMMNEEYPWADFVIPRSGGACFIGNMVIPKQCRDVDAAHKVIDYLLSIEGGLACFDEHAYNPSNRHAYAHLPERVRTHPYLLPNDAVMKKLVVFHNEIPLHDVEKLWHRIKL